VTADLDRAAALVITNNLAAPSALQRWMGVTFREAQNLLNDMQERGYVGPANGSAARTIHVQRCEQCDRIGVRGFTTYPKHEPRPLTVCSNKAACRKRWPTPPVDEAP